MNEVAIYKGENLLCIGTVEDCAAELNIKRDTVLYYGTPSYEKRASKRKGGNFRELVILGDEE